MVPRGVGRAQEPTADIHRGREVSVREMREEKLQNTAPTLSIHFSLPPRGAWPVGLAPRGARMEEHRTSTCPPSLRGSGSSLRSDLGRRHRLGAGLVGHGPLSPWAPGLPRIIAVLVLARGFVICLGPQILKLPCPWLLPMKVQTVAGGHFNAHRLFGAQDLGLGCREAAT